MEIKQSVRFRMRVIQSTNIGVDIYISYSSRNFEFLAIGHERQRSKYLCHVLSRTSGCETRPAKTAQNLGVTFGMTKEVDLPGMTFSFCFHLSAVYKSCRYHIRGLRRIGRYLTLDSAKLLAHALVSIAASTTAIHFYLVLPIRRSHDVSAFRLL